MVHWNMRNKIFDLIELNPDARIIVSLVKAKNELTDKDYQWLKQE